MILINLMIIYLNLLAHKIFEFSWWHNLVIFKTIKFGFLFAQFLISSWSKKGHEPSRAEPSWKSCSSSYDSSKLGSDSSLNLGNISGLVRYCCGFCTSGWLALTSVVYPSWFCIYFFFSNFPWPVLAFWWETFTQSRGWYESFPGIDGYCLGYTSIGWIREWFIKIVLLVLHGQAVCRIIWAIFVPP